MRVSAVLPAILFFAFICGVIYLANAGSDNVIFAAVKTIPFGDKLGHACLFGFLTLLTNRALSWSFAWRTWLQFGSTAVLTFALVEELSQHFNPNRTLDGVDVVADLIGIGTATWISARCAAKRKEPKQSS